MWLKFDRNKELVARKRLSIQRSGVIHFSQALYAAIGEPPEVQLYWEPERRAIGIAPSDGGHSTYRVARTAGKNTKGLQVSVRSFVKYHGLLADRVQHFEAWVEGNMIVAEVGQPPTPPQEQAP